MNIFVTNPCPKLSAKALDDKRVIKMILESAQMLSTVIRSKDEQYAESNSLYKKTHSGHPCVKWTAQSKGNYIWLLKHMEALLEEYTLRFGKQHKSGTLFAAFLDFVGRMPENGLTPFTNCTDFKEVNDVHEAYKKALAAKWKNDKHRPKWTGASQPEWAQQ